MFADSRKFDSFLVYIRQWNDVPSQQWSATQLLYLQHENQWRNHFCRRASQRSQAVLLFSVIHPVSHSSTFSAWSTTEQQTTTELVQPSPRFSRQMWFQKATQPNRIYLQRAAIVGQQPAVFFWTTATFTSTRHTCCRWISQVNWTDALGQVDSCTCLIIPPCNEQFACSQCTTNVRGSLQIGYFLMVVTRMDTPKSKICWKTGAQALQCACD